MPARAAFFTRATSPSEGWPGKAHDKASGLSVDWSVRTLLALSSINDPKQGEKTRLKLKSIYETHMKDVDPDLEMYWDKEMLAAVEKIVQTVLAPTAWAAWASSAEAASSSQYPGPSASSPPTAAKAAAAAESRAEASAKAAPKAASSAGRGKKRKQG